MSQQTPVASAGSTSPAPGPQGPAAPVPAPNAPQSGVVCIVNPSPELESIRAEVQGRLAEGDALHRALQSTQRSWPVTVDIVRTCPNACELCGHTTTVTVRRCGHQLVEVGEIKAYYGPAADTIIRGSKRKAEPLEALNAKAARLGVRFAALPEHAQPGTVALAPAPVVPLVGVEPNPGPFGALRKLKFKMHGNYGGPGYSAGKFTETPDWNVKSVDEQDEVYRKHDYDYTKMDKDNADALLVERMKKLGAWKAGAKGQLAALGFHFMGMGRKPTRPKYTYPWEEKRLTSTRVHPPRPEPAIDHGRRVEAGGHGMPLPTPVAASAGEHKLHDPQAATSATMAVEPNPGPPKRRARSASRKGSRKSSKGGKRRSHSAKGSRKGKRSHKGGGGGGTGRPRKGPGARGKGAAASAGQKNQSAPFTRTDLVYSGTVSGAAVPGTVLYSAAINPSGLQVGTSNSIIATYLNYESRKWEQFDCQVHFTVKATGATTIAGTFAHGIDSDVTDVLPGGTIEAVQRLTGQGGNVNTWAAGGRAEFNKLNSAKATPRYWVQPASDSDSRLVAKGKYWLIVNEPTTSYFAAGSGQAVNVNFQVFAHYTFRFYNATLEITQGLAGGQSGLWWDNSSGVSNTDPLGFGSVNLATLWNLAPSNAQNDLWVYTDGTQGIMYFGVGGNDNVNYVVVACEVTGTTPRCAVTAAGGATLVKQIDTASSTDETNNTILGLSNTSAQVSVTGTAFRKVNGGFQTYLNPTFRHYGGAVFSGFGGTTITAASVSVASFQTYTPTATDRMLLCAGPATMEYKHINSWDCSTSLEKHLETKRAQDRQRESDLRLIMSDQKRLEAEHRLDIEAMSLQPTPTVSEDEVWPEPSLESKSSRPTIAPKGILKR